MNAKSLINDTFIVILNVDSASVGIKRVNYTVKEAKRTNKKEKKDQHI